MRTTMRSRYGRLLAAALVFVLAGCTAPGGRETAGSVEQSTPSVAPAATWTPGESFPIAAFDDIPEEPVPKEMAAKFEAALREMAGGWDGGHGDVPRRHMKWSGGQG